MKMKGRTSGKSHGGAILWILIILVAAVGGYIVWKRLAPPKVAPKPVIAEATPIPATPPPATPEPVVVKATPTPVPVVVATPTPPPPTPPPLELATVVKTPALWPKQVALVQAINFPIMLNGRSVGEVKAPVGAALRVVRVGNPQMEIDYQNTLHVIPVASTDLMQRALATFRANGSVIPEAPAVAAAPTPVTPTATPTPAAPAKLKLEVDVDRKRLDLVKDGKSGNRKEDETITEKYNYVIKVQSREFIEIPPLEVQYLIFVERQKLGSQKDDNPVDRITGSGKIEGLNPKNQLQTITTSELEVSRSIQNAKWGGYVNGGRRKVEDTILGIWVKVLKEGQVVAEYANPSTVTKRGWEQKQ